MAPDDLQNMTPEEKERMEKAEQEALNILRSKMREGRWYPRRHMLFAFYILFGAVALVAIVSGIASLFSHH